jgi:UDP-2,3-diacylglucosamine pyrophosphatase LpxH
MTIHGGRRNRALFLSDLHLATRACRARALLDFLRSTDADTIYLVGDIIDFWRIQRGAVWPQAHSDVVQALMHRMRSGTRLVLVPGNHDEGLRDFCGLHLTGMEIHGSCIHTTAGGLRLLVTHGDEFDVVVRYAQWLAYLGGWGHGLARSLNAPWRWMRRRLGRERWSLSAWVGVGVKLKVKTAVNFIGAFETALAAEARRQGLDGVVCGHIHHAAHREIGGVQYLNCGDWVDSCTAVTEDAAGALHVVRWRESRCEGRRRPASRLPHREAA